MWGWFGGATAASKKKDVTKDAILKLRQQLEMLQKKEKHLEQLVGEQDSIARKLVQTNKNGLCCLFPPAFLGCLKMSLHREWM